MNLLAETLDALKGHGLSCAVIGAAAMAAHGVARATMDVDLLLVGRESLDSRAWEQLQRTGAEVEIRRGAPDDPLAGVVRVRHDQSQPIDIVIGAAAWQRRAIERAVPATILGMVAPVATAPDLILLKLYAGSPQDCWDISRLLAASSAEGVEHAVESELPSLPVECGRLWKTIVDTATR
ncbi:MAG: hypothetical protein ABR587_12980 [Candidatus Binatia bacterium]